MQGSRIDTVSDGLCNVMLFRERAHEALKNMQEQRLHLERQLLATQGAIEILESLLNQDGENDNSPPDLSEILGPHVQVESVEKTE